MVNGAPRDVAGPTLATVLDELGYGGTIVATAVNDDFVPVPGRAALGLAPGDRLEVLAPMQGG
jgi:sulfur carrier protein